MKTSPLQLRSAKYTCKPLLGACTVFLASVDQYRAIPETRNFGIRFILQAGVLKTPWRHVSWCEIGHRFLWDRPSQSAS